MLGAPTINRFAVLLVHLTLLFALVDASGLHSGTHHRSVSHRKIRRAPVEPFNPAPNCPKRNYFKKLRDAQGLSTASLNSNGTATATSTSLTVASSSVSSSAAASLSTEATTTKSPSSTTSSSEPEETDSKPPTSPASGGLSALFPLGQTSKSWTTSPESPNALSISEATLQPFQVARSNPYAISKAPDGRNALRARFNKGSYKLNDSPTGGFSFYASGPENVDLTNAKEATFGYRVFFPNGFDFNRGGKLPGFCAYFLFSRISVLS